MAVPPERPTLTPAALDALRRLEAAQPTALRENLRRRKQQARRREASAAGPDDGGDAAPPGSDDR